eukprot:CAMPEP_0119129538 /NCGR_PEP_ID=MMETSP1310-20130426/7241_1 /TAXON_ID=464262 /ORGANISM="Genus nov. species nov., Strain RCC2339" /LENGTH=1263 /DNA_ID=CAMNT_0007119965 /DNA_START=174 /DNA_END=3965 /DNA_ORIENTATION=-
MAKKSAEELERSLGKAIKRAEESKGKGNKSFGEKKYEAAVGEYSHGVALLLFTSKAEYANCPSLDVALELLATLRSNRALCLLKVKRNKEAIKDCDEVLARYPTHEKALFRRAKGHEAMGRLDLAFRDMHTALQRDTSNKVVLREFNRLKRLYSREKPTDFVSTQMSLIAKGEMTEKLQAASSICKATYGSAGTGAAIAVDITLQDIFRKLLNLDDPHLERLCGTGKVEEAAKEELAFVVVHSGKGIDVSLPPSATVQELKELLVGRTSLRAEAQLLVGAEVFFCKKATLSSYGVMPGSQITLLSKTTSKLPGDTLERLADGIPVEDQKAVLEEEKRLFRIHGSASCLRAQLLQILGNLFKDNDMCLKLSDSLDVTLLQNHLLKTTRSADDAVASLGVMRVRDDLTRSCALVLENILRAETQRREDLYQAWLKARPKVKPPTLKKPGAAAPAGNPPTSGAEESNVTIGAAEAARGGSDGTTTMVVDDKAPVSEVLIEEVDEEAEAAEKKAAEEAKRKEAERLATRKKADEEAAKKKADDEAAALERPDLPETVHSNGLVDVMMRVVREPRCSSSALQCAFRILAQYNWKEHQVEDFVTTKLAHVLRAGTRAPVVGAPSVTSSAHYFADLGAHKMSAVVLAAVFDTVQSRRRREGLTQAIKQKCAETLGPLLRRDGAEDNIQGLLMLLGVMLANNEIGKDILVQEMTTVTTGLTSFPKASAEAKHVLLLLTSEIIATAASSKEFRKSHIQIGDIHEMFLLAKNQDLPDVQGRAVSTVAKLAADSAEAKQLALRNDGEDLLNISAAILEKYNKGEEFGKTKENMFLDKMEGDDTFGERNVVYWVMEGISFLTSLPEFKTFIMDHPTLLRNMFTFMSGVDFMEDTEGPRARALRSRDRNSSSTSDFGFVGAIYNLTFDPERALKPEDKEKVHQLEQLHEKAGVKDKPRIHENDKSPVVEKRTIRLLQLGVGRALSVLGAAVSRLAPSVQELLSGIFLHLSVIREFRGSLVADGAMPILISLGSKASTLQGKYIASQAMARILITTNPNLALTNGNEYNCIEPLINCLKNDDDGLMQFEALMALTNVASMNENVANSIAERKRLVLIEALHHENVQLLRRAATELLCNLSFSENYLEALAGPGGETRVLILSKLIFEEDLPTANAAAAVLASAGALEDVAKNILAKGDLEAFTYGTSSDRPMDLQHRCIVAIAHMTEYQEMATRLAEDANLLLNVDRISKGAQYDTKLRDVAQHALANFKKIGVSLE